MNNANKPAMPLKYEGGNGTVHIYTGLTKREHFAVSILSGMCSEPSTKDISWGSLVASAIKGADSLLAGLEKTET